MDVLPRLDPAVSGEDQLHEDPHGPDFDTWQLLTHGSCCSLPPLFSDPSRSLYFHCYR